MNLLYDVLNAIDAVVSTNQRELAGKFYVAAANTDSPVTVVMWLTDAGYYFNWSVQRPGVPDRTDRTRIFIGVDEPIGYKDALHATMSVVLASAVQHIQENAARQCASLAELARGVALGSTNAQVSAAMQRLMDLQLPAHT